MKIKIDSRDFKFHQKFGQTTSFPKELIFDAPSKDFIQPIGDVRCTAITVCEVTTDKTHKQYDIQELFNRIPSDGKGAEPKDALKAGVSYLRVENAGTEKPWVSYWQAHTGEFDAFDNVRSAITLAQNSITMWSPWYDNWANKQILPKGENITNYHMYHIEGWTEIDGVPMMQIEAYVGYKLYMTREVFNDVISKWFSSTAVLSTSEIDEKRKKTIIEAIIDACKNAIVAIQMLIKQQEVLPIADPTPIEQPMENKNESLYNLSKSLIGQHLTLNPTVPKEVGCAQAMSFVLKKFGCDIPKNGISSTVEMKKWLDINFDKVDAPQRGSVMIAVTGTGSKKEYRGHVFVYGNEASMSNDSSTGLWKAHWFNENAKKYYGGTLGIPLHYYNPR